tara:strand:+ start:28 stop:567 length:540 start_codon:yes stop_codon:yes gene_type:complete
MPSNNSNSEYARANKQLNNTIKQFQRQIINHKRKSNNLIKKAKEQIGSRTKNQLSPRSKKSAIHYLRSKKMHNKQIDSLQKKVVTLKNQKKALINSGALRNRVNSLRKSRKSVIAKPPATARVSANITHNELMNRYIKLIGNTANNVNTRNTRQPKSITRRLGKSLSSMFRKSNKNSVV